MLSNLIFFLRAEVVGDDFNIVDSSGWFELLKVDFLILQASFLVVPLVRMEPLSRNGGWPLIDVTGGAPFVWTTFFSEVASRSCGPYLVLHVMDDVGWCLGTATNQIGGPSAISKRSALPCHVVIVKR